MATYKGRRKIQQLAHLKEGYKGKNESGGRKCVFGQCREYAKGYSPTAIRWPWESSSRFILEDTIEHNA